MDLLNPFVCLYVQVHTRNKRRWNKMQFSQIVWSRFFESQKFLNNLQPSRRKQDLVSCFFFFWSWLGLLLLCKCRNRIRCIWCIIIRAICIHHVQMIFGPFGSMLVLDRTLTTTHNSSTSAFFYAQFTWSFRKLLLILNLSMAPDILGHSKIVQNFAWHACRTYRFSIRLKMLALLIPPALQGRMKNILIVSWTFCPSPPRFLSEIVPNFWMLEYSRYSVCASIHFRFRVNVIKCHLVMTNNFSSDRWSFFSFRIWY